MTKKRCALAFFLYFSCNLSYAYIDAAIKMDIVGNREVILMFDAYEGYTTEFNQANAVNIVASVKKFARQNQHETIDFSYEDPGAYATGNLLKSKLAQLMPYVDSVAEDQTLTFIQTLSSFPIMAFKKPKKFTTFLGGDLTRALALFPQSDWPENLRLHSNDPRQVHMLALTHSKTWLLKNEKSIRMRNLITAAPLLKARRLAFEVDDQLSKQQQVALINIFNEFAHKEQEQLEAFANFASVHTKQSINVADLHGSIFDLKDKISLDLVYQFLSDMKKCVDIYDDAPIIDVLLTMFDAKRSDKMVIILGNLRAIKLVQALATLGMIESGCDIPQKILYSGDW